MQERGWLLLTIVLGVLLASTAALPETLARHKGEFEWEEWGLAVALSVAVAAVVFLSTGRSSQWAVPAWCRCLAALGLAMLVPLANTSSLYHRQADLALLVGALALAGGLADSHLIRWCLGIPLAALACGLEACFWIWPIGYMWSSWSYRRERLYGFMLMAAAMTGIWVAVVLGRSLLTGYRFYESAYALHRDLLLLAPVLILGYAGYARTYLNTSMCFPDERLRPLPVAMTIVALMMILAGQPLNVRLIVLPLWWYVPEGIEELAGMIEGDSGRPRLCRYMGFAALLALVVLAWPGLRAWQDGVWLGLYVMKVF